MLGVNKVILLGNVGKDPEVQHLDGGVTVAKFPLATTETFKDKNGNKVDQTEWHNIVAWRGLADVAEKIVKKGSQVYIEGKLRTRKWEDKDKNTRYTTEVVADVITITGRRVENHVDNHTNHVAQPVGQPAAANPGTNTDDLPF